MYFQLPDRQEPGHRDLKLITINSTDVCMESVMCQASDREKDGKDGSARRHMSGGQEVQTILLHEEVPQQRSHGEVIWAWRQVGVSHMDKVGVGI